MYAAPSFIIAFLRSLREETTAVPYPERPQCPVMDASSETIDIMLSPYISELHTAMSDASPPTLRAHRREGSPEAPRTARGRENADRHVAS